MHPELFTVTFFAHDRIVHAYSFFYGIAMCVVIVGTYVFAVKRGFLQKHIILFLLAATIGGCMGARILHFVTNIDAYASGAYDIFAVNMEGFAISGGFIGAIFAGWIVAKKLQLDIWTLGDISVVSLGCGIAIARIGCFLNGCCFGHMTRLPWSVKFPVLSYAHQYQLSHGAGSVFSVYPMHPTQLYEAAAAIAGSIFAIYLIRKKSVSGVAIIVFGAWFAFFRLVNMQLRIMPNTFDAPKLFYPILYVSVMIICGILYMHRLKKMVPIAV